MAKGGQDPAKVLGNSHSAPQFLSRTSLWDDSIFLLILVGITRKLGVKSNHFCGLLCGVGLLPSSHKTDDISHLVFTENPRSIVKKSIFRISSDLVPAFFEIRPIAYR